MRTHKDVNAEAFAARLRRACIERGHKSSRSASGVDVGAVATNGGCSYEMARRYVGGLATPSEEVMRALASWLRVPVGWLAYGEHPDGSTESAPISAETLEACLAAVQEAQEIAGVTLPPARAAALVAALYREAAEGAPVTARAIAASLRALT